MKNAVKNSDYTTMAKTILEVADAIELTEMEIKRELLKAANDDDLEKIRVIITRWINGPVTNVLEAEQRGKIERTEKF